MVTERRLSAVLISDMVGFSRLVEADETRLLARLSTYRHQIIDPGVTEAGGALIKSTGDGILAEFGSVRDAVDCAKALQHQIADKEAHEPPERRISFRIGIHVGEVVVEENDIFGDTVNMAARLETLAASDGIVVSDTVLHMLEPDVQAAFSDLGTQRFKNITRPMRVWQWTRTPRREYAAHPGEAAQQEIGFCAAPDGVTLAFATVGQGPAVFKAPNWINHLDFDWRSPLAGPGLAQVARHNRLVRFDQRGNGLSDWEVEDISDDTMILDMEAVVAATGLQRFALFGQSQGCAFSVRYAVENPEKITCLVLLGGYARGNLRRGSKDQEALHNATNALIREGWGSDNPAYRHVFTETMLPEARADQKATWDERQRMATSAQNAARINDMNARIDVTDLAGKITAPTLVCHSEGDRRIPPEEGRRLAALIPGAEFLALPGANHILVEGSEGFELFHDRFRRFVAQHAD